MIDLGERAVAEAAVLYHSAYGTSGEPRALVALFDAVDDLTTGFALTDSGREALACATITSSSSRDTSPTYTSPASESIASSPPETIGSRGLNGECL